MEARRGIGCVVGVKRRVMDVLPLVVVRGDRVGGRRCVRDEEEGMVRGAEKRGLSRNNDDKHVAGRRYCPSRPEEEGVGAGNKLEFSICEALNPKL